jgi:hypothetical protein
MARRMHHAVIINAAGGVEKEIDRHQPRRSRIVIFQRVIRWSNNSR